MTAASAPGPAGGTAQPAAGRAAARLLATLGPLDTATFLAAISGISPGPKPEAVDPPNDLTPP